MRRLRRALLTLPVLVLAYLGAALIGALIPNGQTGGNWDDGTRSAGLTAVNLSAGGPDQVTVWLASSPIHYDFVLPNDAPTRAAFGFAERGGVPLSDASVQWIVVGWGSRAFYTQTGTYADLSMATAWTAASGDASVLHVGVATSLDGFDARPLRLTPAEYARLRDAILTPAPDPTAIDGFTLYDRFFATPGRFHLLRTCNVWVADVMARAGLAFGRWTPTPYAVTLSLARFQPET